MPSLTYNNITIRGITYNVNDTYDPFVCYEAESGNGSSEGSGGSAASLVKGNTYYLYVKATGEYVKYPYGICTSRGGSVHSWHTEKIFPYATYTYSFNANGGTGAPLSMTKTYGVHFTFPTAKPTRTGYTFVGWSKSSTATSGYSAGQQVAGLEDKNTTWYAIWKINQYTNTINHWALGFQNSEGNNSSKNSYSLTSTTFTSDYNDSFVLNSSRATTIPNGYYLSHIGTDDISGSWQSYNLPITVTQKASNMMFDYYYQPNSYTITYNMNGGTNSNSNPSSYNVLYGVTFANPNDRNGYRFNNWTNSSGTTVTGINVGVNASFSSATDLYNKLSSRTTGNQTITANWTPITYNITIDCNGGSGVSSRTYTIETATFTLGTPTREGYTFLGWTGSNGSTAQKSVSITKGSTGNKSYTANWKVNTYTITYKANGGSGSDQTQTVTYGTSWTTKDKAFTRVGYKLESWNTKADGTGTKYNLNTKQTDKQLSNVTLYAQWKISGVVYISNGTKLEPYLAYIDNGTGWDLYLAYVDNGSSWDIIS